MAGRVPPIRIRAVNGAPLRGDGRFVLYWMTAFRRASRNFALDRAAEASRELGRPLLVLEGLRAGYRWASDRLHAFVLQGMADNRRAFGEAGVAYHPYLEPEPEAGRGLLAALAARAALVVTDDSPSFFLARMVAAAGARLEVRLEAVDSIGLLPLAAAATVHSTVHAFRRFLQRDLPRHLASFPLPAPAPAAGARRRGASPRRRLALAGRFRAPAGRRSPGPGRPPHRPRRPAGAARRGERRRPGDAPGLPAGAAPPLPPAQPPR